MAKLDIAAAVSKYERTIKGVPSELNHGTRYMVSDSNGNIVFESHDANQAEGVRMRTIGSRTVVYDPTKVVGGGPMESLERMAVASSPLVESTEANSNTCPVCETESGDSEYCTSCGSGMQSEESNDSEDEEVDEASLPDVPASTKRGTRRIATGAAVAAAGAYALGAKKKGLTRAAAAGGVGGYVHHRSAEKAKKKADAEKYSGKALELRKEDYNLDEMSKANRLKLAKAKGLIKGHTKAIAFKSGGAIKKGASAVSKHLQKHGDEYAAGYMGYRIGKAMTAPSGEKKEKKD